MEEYLNTNEGKQIVGNLKAYVILERGGTTIPPTIPPKPKKIDKNDARVDFFIQEIISLRNNSINVVEDCDRIIETFKTKEEYIKSDVKVAKYIHTKAIERYNRILNYQSAFENR